MKLCSVFLVAGLLATTFSSTAGVVIGGTRLVYDGAKKEAALNVSNPDKTAYLIQSWVETQEGGEAKAPFIITPPLFRLDGNQNNVLRIVRAGGSLPEDKESLFWLNIKSIPSSEKRDNTLQIAVKTRIKLIYRPKGVQGTLDQSASQIKWQRSGNTLKATNNSGHYLTFFAVKIAGKAIPDFPMLAPGATQSVTLPAVSAGNQVSWEIINDYGGTSEAYQASL
ncbi:MULTISPECIES: molecular chaperone [unclassified Serratia (in: enterobacteria)]|uniref:fimbrial biogenesis chaperone n=1 Tax=unclassified Serratia (in: enterobacteria) TaxID=2647522 RepID=UPI000469C1AB|nr:MULTISPECIES: molecular chaperone [unclassified Serratia (in: enterobacteria)]